MIEIEVSLREAIALQGVYQGAVEMHFIKAASENDAAILAAESIAEALRSEGIYLGRQRGEEPSVVRDDERKLKIGLTVEQAKVGLRLCIVIEHMGDKSDESTQAAMECRKKLRLKLGYTNI